MTDIITTESPWQDALQQVTEYDFYDNWEYHALEAERLGAEPMMLAHREGDALTLLPMLVRPIEDSDNRDATSVYGYSGLRTSAAVDANALATALRAFEQTLSERNIITLFTRLHPIADEGRELVLGEVLTPGRTVSIDLSIDPEEGFSLYAKGHRTDVRRLRSAGYTCRVSKSDEDIQLFHRVYLDTMARLSASQEYLFDLAYITRIVKSEQLDVRIIVCELDGEVAAIATFSYQKPFIQGHLAGNTAAHIKKSPMKLIYDFVRLQGIEEGYRWFHLGGGVGGKLDNLYKFKRDFSKTEHEFRLWRWVIDQDAYQELCRAKGRDTETPFFPAYRAPVVDDASVDPA